MFILNKAMIILNYENLMFHTSRIYSEMPFGKFAQA